MDQKQYIKENYKKIPSTKIGEHLGIPHTKVQAIAATLGLTVLHPRVKKHKEKVLYAYYEERKTIAELRKELNLGKSTVTKILKNYGSGGRKPIDVDNHDYTCDESFFEKIDTPEKAYWFGFLAADGNIYNNKLQIGLAAKDIAHLELFCKRINYNGPIYQDRTNFKVIISRKKITDDLQNLGLKINKTLTLDENIFNNIPSCLLSAAFHGYFDGDGCFSVSQYGVTASIVGNESFLCFFREYISKFGIWMSEPKKDKRTKQTFEMGGWLTKERGLGFKKMFYENQFSSKDFLDRKKKRLYDKFPNEPSI